MPLALAAPVASLLAAAMVTWLAGRLGLRTNRWPAAAGAWLAGAALLAARPGGRRVVEFNAGTLGGGIQLSLHLDALAAVFMLFTLVPAALLLTFQRREAGEASLAVLAVAATLLALQGGGLLLLALLTGAAATVLLLVLQVELDRPPWRLGLATLAASLSLAWSGVMIQVSAGTAQLSAIPPLALQTAPVLLMLLAALLLIGAVPGMGWNAHLWHRPHLAAISLAAALLLPLGFHLLFRLYDLSGGGLPGGWLNPALAALGTVTLVLAAARGQAAANQREFLGELAPALTGLALFALGMARPSALAAALTTLAALALVVTLAPLIPQGRARLLLAALAVAVGVPPSLTFGAAVLDLQSAIELGDFYAGLALLAALGWLLLLFGAARAVRLPGSPEGAGSPAGSVVVLLALLVGGVLLGPLESGFGAPGLRLPATYQASLQGVATVSGAWPVLPTVAPLMLVAAILAAVWSRWGGPEITISTKPHPPFFALPWRALDSPARELAAVLAAIPSTGLFKPAGSERVMAAGSIGLWAAVLVALSVALSR